jgi:protoporphyrinogen oxidase
MNDRQYDVAIVGAGFTGLAAAYALSKQGFAVCVIEKDEYPGGLAGAFEFTDGVRIEKFYHHWFKSDAYVSELIEELGLSGEMVSLSSRTGMYLNRRIWDLSSPMDLLRFSPLSLIDRFRLGLLVFQVRRVTDWREIEHLSIREWLEPICGEKVYRLVWEPLITAKFSVHAESVSAVWFWKKLVLRGSTRDKKGGEQLAYFRGGFIRLAEALVSAVKGQGGEVRFGEAAVGLRVEAGRIAALRTTRREIAARQFLFTPALPIIAGILREVEDPSWTASLLRVRYLGNICLVLRMDRSLSDIYWLNVNDPGFPFVGVIEHTNFDSPDNYRGSRIAFLSRYLPVEDPHWSLADQDYLELALEHLQRMFPSFQRSWIIESRIWRAEYAQPVVERNYSQYVPGRETPFPNGSISTMAHVYPEDRGTNYAIREGRAAAAMIAGRLDHDRIMNGSSDLAS